MVQYNVAAGFAWDFLTGGPGPRLAVSVEITSVATMARKFMKNVGHLIGGVVKLIVDGFELVDTLVTAMRKALSDPRSICDALDGHLRNACRNIMGAFGTIFKPLLKPVERVMGSVQQIFKTNMGWLLEAKKAGRRRMQVTEEPAAEGPTRGELIMTKYARFVTEHMLKYQSNQTVQDPTSASSNDTMSIEMPRTAKEQQEVADFMANGLFGNDTALPDASKSSCRLLLGRLQTARFTGRRRA